MCHQQETFISVFSPSNSRIRDGDPGSSSWTPNLRQDFVYLWCHCCYLGCLTRNSLQFPNHVASLQCQSSSWWLQLWKATYYWSPTRVSWLASWEQWAGKIWLIISHPYVLLYYDLHIFENILPTPTITLFLLILVSSVLLNVTKQPTKIGNTILKERGKWLLLINLAQSVPKYWLNET